MNRFLFRNTLVALGFSLLAIAQAHAVTPIDRGAFGGAGQSAFTATAWTPTAGNVVLAIVSSNSNTLTAPTAWGTWQTLVSKAVDSNGVYWYVFGVVVGSGPTSQAPSVGVSGGGSGEAYFVEIPGLNTSNLSALVVQSNNAAKTSTSGDRTMATTLSTFASASNLCFVEKYGYGSQPWTAVSPLTILAQYTNTGSYDYTASAYYNGQDLAPEIDGSSPGDGMGILAMELKVASGSTKHPEQFFMIGKNLRSNSGAQLLGFRPKHAMGSAQLAAAVRLPPEGSALLSEIFTNQRGSSIGKSVGSALNH